ncbi:CHAT domain-containing protein [Desulfococcaceae bacterium HSG7]|nr:CHAT domain-containing protein [Desulfococcaceae bacterium HSG7]
MSDIYSQGRKKCLGCGVMIYTAPSVILGEYHYKNHLSFGACINGHIYCDNCNKDFLKDRDAYHICHCGEPLGSYCGLNCPLDESRRFKNSESIFYTQAQRNCFHCGRKFYTDSVSTIAELPDQVIVSFFACEGEHLVCEDCHKNYLSDLPGRCSIGNCNLPLDKYFATNDPAYIGADYLKESELSEFTEVRYIISRGRGCIEIIENDYTLFCTEAENSDSIESKLDQWLDLIAYRKGRSFKVVEKTFDGGGSFQKCAIPFSRIKKTKKENISKTLSSLELQFKSELTKLQKTVLSSLIDSATPRLLSLTEEQLFEIFTKLLDKAIETVDRLGLDKEVLNNPILLVELAFEQHKEWEIAEAYHLINHDYFIAKHFDDSRYLLPILRYKCAYCSHKRGEAKRCYFFSNQTKEILHWHNRNNLDWLGYQIHIYMASFLLDQGVRDEAILNYRTAVDEAVNDEDTASVLHTISEIYRQSNQPDQAYTFIEKAKTISDRLGGSVDLKKIIDVSYNLLKLELSGREEDMKGLEKFVESITSEEQKMVPDALKNMLRNITENYGHWLRKNELPRGEDLRTLKKTSENWLKSLSEQEPEDRINAIISLLPVLGELKEYDLFQKHLEYGLYTAEKQQIPQKWLKLKRLGLRFQSISGGSQEITEEYQTVMARMENEPDKNEMLIFYSEYIEALVRSNSSAEKIFPLLNKVKDTYHQLRTRNPTIEGRMFFRTTHQRTLEIAILACLTYAGAAQYDRKEWLVHLTDFLELAKGQSLFDYVAGFNRKELNSLTYSEHKEYLEKETLLYQTLENFGNITQPLTELQDFEIHFRAKYFKNTTSKSKQKYVVDFSLPDTEDIIIINYFFFKEYTKERPGLAVIYYHNLITAAILPSEDEIANLVRKWKTRRYKLCSYSASLYQLLIQVPLDQLKIRYPGLIPQIGGNLNAIGIIPEGIITDIPFEAIGPLTEKNERLIHCHKIFYLHSLRQFKMTSEDCKPKYWCGFGSPIHYFDDEILKKNLPELPFSGQEIISIHAILKPHCHTKFFIAEENQKDSFIKLLRGVNSPSILHFAIHGLGGMETPENSSIFFSTHDTNGERINGRLSFREIVRMDLRSVDLVVLSVCESAVGKNMAGEGNQALSWAFKAAGAKYVIASRWKLNDEAASQIMTSFYGNFLEFGDISSSLRMAQLDFIDRNPEATALKWSSFALYL